MQSLGRNKVNLLLFGWYDKKNVCGVYRNFEKETWRTRIQGISKYEPRCEKTGLRGFRPGPTQTGLYNHTRWLEA